MPVEIKYDGDTVATMGAGQSATLNCGGYTMRGNVEVLAGYDGITYTQFVEALNAAVQGAMPVKGVDYNTEEDKADMVERVLAALKTWTGGSY